MWTTFSSLLVWNINCISALSHLFNIRPPLEIPSGFALDWTAGVALISFRLFLRGIYGHDCHCRCKTRVPLLTTADDHTPSLSVVSSTISEHSLLYVDGIVGGKIIPFNDIAMFSLNGVESQNLMKRTIVLSCLCCGGTNNTVMLLHRFNMFYYVFTRHPLDKDHNNHNRREPMDGLNNGKPPFNGHNR